MPISRKKFCFMDVRAMVKLLKVNSECTHFLTNFSIITYYFTLVMMIADKWVKTILMYKYPNGMEYIYI